MATDNSNLSSRLNFVSSQEGVEIYCFDHFQEVSVEVIIGYFQIRFSSSKCKLSLEKISDLYTENYKKL